MDQNSQGHGFSPDFNTPHLGSQHPSGQAHPTPPPLGQPYTQATSPMAAQVQQTPPLPSKLNTGVVIELSATVTILLIATILVIWAVFPANSEKAASVPSIDRGVSRSIEKTHVLERDVNDGKPSNAYSILLNGDYALVFSSDLETTRYAVVDITDGSIPESLPDSISLPDNTSHTTGTFPSCNDDERYVLGKKGVHCEHIPEYEPIKDGVIGQITYSDDTMKLATGTTSGGGTYFSCLNPSGEPLWIQELDKPADVSTDGTHVIATFVDDDGVSIEVYAPDEHAPQSASPIELPQLEADAIRHVDFGNLTWYMRAPNYDGDCDSASSPEECRYPYQMVDRQYWLDDSTKDGFAIANGFDSWDSMLEENSAPRSDGPYYYVSDTNDVQDSDIAVEYGDVDGDGYEDAVVSLFADLSVFGANNYIVMKYLWHMNPQTGQAEIVSTPIWGNSRCYEAYDYTEFPGDGTLVVHDLTFDSPEMSCCGCDRTKPQVSHVWMYDAETNSVTLQE